MLTILSNIKNNFYFLMRKYSILFTLTLASLICSIELSYMIIETSPYPIHTFIFQCVGYIFGIIFSFKMKRFKWYSALIFSLFGSICILSLPYFAINIKTLNLMSLIIYFMYGIVNSLFIRCFIEQMKDEKKLLVGSIFLGMMLITLGSIFFQGSILIATKVSGQTMVYILGSITLLTGMYGYEKEGILN